MVVNPNRTVRMMRFVAAIQLPSDDLVGGITWQSVTEESTDGDTGARVFVFGTRCDARLQYAPDRFKS